MFLRFAATLVLIAGVVVAKPVNGQVVSEPAPQIAAGRLPDDLSIDGRLDEPAWQQAAAFDAFTQTQPVENAPPSRRTVVRVLAGRKALVIGIVCDDDPAGIVSFSKQRDAALRNEDHVNVVLGPFMDGRSGYVFAVNPSGARYDALIEPGGESENPNWDGIWEAGTARTPTGWSVEIRIPVDTIGFKPGLTSWHFNVERRVQRIQENDRWASPARQYKVTQTSRAGVLTGLPEFSLGRGLSVRPAMTAGAGIPSPAAGVASDAQPSLDVTQRIGSNVLGSLTVNTDFAEAEVDTRRTNLTRFPLFFPEKRTFFLEGSDLFTFGLGLNEDVIPYFSRRIGLVAGNPVPIIAGGKVGGRVKNTNFGGLVVGTNDKLGVVEDNAMMAVGRVKQNIWSESWVGAIVTVGDPLNRQGSWLAGADFTYATSRFRGDKNFLVGVWGLATDREGMGPDRSSYGFTVDYPNNKWDLLLSAKRIGENFDPSVGFVPRRSSYLYHLTINNTVQVSHGPLQTLFHEFEPFFATDLAGRWESYRTFMAPINWRFRSGDRMEFNVVPAGERLGSIFEVADGVVIAPGSYQWLRYRLEAGTAQKRKLYAQVAWWFGGFYDGSLDQIVWTGAWNPVPLVTLEFAGEHDRGRLPSGDFETTVVGTRLRLNISPDMTAESYVQYDTDSASVGVNSRLRWTFNPVGDLFVVYNHNLRDRLDRWQLESNQLLVKLQYAFRF